MRVEASLGRAAMGAALLVATSTARAQSDSRFEEHALGSVPPGVDVARGIEFAADGMQVAYVGSRDGALVPVIGAKGFDARWHVDQPRLSAGGAVAFIVAEPPAKQVHMSWLLVDGKREPRTEGIESFAWSPDGSRFAFVNAPECKIAGDQSRVGPFILVIDGKRGAKWHSISEPVWSNDSKHVLAVSEEKGKECLLLDNKPFAEGARYYGPVFSPDGSRIAYACEPTIKSASRSTARRRPRSGASLPRRASRPTERTWRSRRRATARSPRATASSASPARPW